LDHKVYALDAVDGSIKDSYPTGAEVQSSPTLSPDGSMVFVGSSDNKLYALSATDLSFQWSFAMNGGMYPFSSPAVSADGSTLYVGSYASSHATGSLNFNIVYALSTADGWKKWEFPAGESVSSPQLSPDGSTLYVGVYALKTADGSLVGRWFGGSRGSVLSRDGSMLYIAGAPSSGNAPVPRNGGSDRDGKKWKRTTDNYAYVYALRTQPPQPSFCKTLLLYSAGILAALALALGLVFKHKRFFRNSIENWYGIPANFSETMLPVHERHDEADGVDLLVFVCEEACGPQIDALKELMQWEEHNFKTKKDTFGGPASAVGPVRLSIQRGADSFRFETCLRKKRPRWLHFMGHSSRADVGPGRLELAYGETLTPDELHRIVVGVAAGSRSRLEMICFSSCNILSNDGVGGRRHWIRDLGERWHVIGFKTRVLTGAGLEGFFNGVYQSLLDDPAQYVWIARLWRISRRRLSKTSMYSGAFRHGWMTGVSVANSEVENASYVIGNPAPSERESCYYRNPNPNDENNEYDRIAFGVPLLLSPNGPGAPPAEHSARLFEQDNPWDRYPACALEGCCDRAEEGDTLCAYHGG
jgi:hypothetical protein